MEKQKKRIQLKTSEMGESILAAILFLIIGIYLITNPKDLIQTISIIFGVVLAIIGAFKLMLYYKAKDGEKREVLSGGVLTIFGLVLVICSLVWMKEITDILRFILAIYLLYIGVFRFVYAFKGKGNKKPYFINAGIILLIGVLLIIIPGLFDAPLIAIGVLLVLYGIAEIAGFVLGRKNGNGVTVTEAVVVSEKDEDVKLLK